MRDSLCTASRMRSAVKADGGQSRSKSRDRWTKAGGAQYSVRFSQPFSGCLLGSRRPANALVRGHRTGPDHAPTLEHRC
jgi:hypothetical protein